MGEAIQFSIEGLEKVNERLKRLSVNVQSEVHKETIKAALEVEQRAKHRARKRYGFLRASIGHVDTGQIVGTPPGGAPDIRAVWRVKPMEVDVGSGMVYAGPMEYYDQVPDPHGPPPSEGWSPWLAPSFDEVKPLYRNGCRKAIARAILLK